MGRLTLMLGGQKSGKSSLAARRATASGRPVVVVTPAVVRDPEFAARVARHRADRPAGWRTCETFDLPAAVTGAPPNAFLLVDALDTWLAESLQAAGIGTGDEIPDPDQRRRAEAAVLAELRQFAAAVAGRDVEAVVIAGQPGLGIHAGGAGARAYVDLHGLAVQALSAAADEVLLVVGGRGLPIPPEPEVHRGGDAPVALEQLLAAVVPVDQGAAASARQRQRGLAKPPGSLGHLEELGAQLAAISGRCPPPVPAAPALVVAAADHGVHAQGISDWPQAVTGAMVSTMASGRASVNAIARTVGARVLVLDVGTAGGGTASGGTAGGETAGGAPVPAGVRDARVRPATRDLTVEPAMTASECATAIGAGAAAARELLAAGADLLATGDLGIGNTTATACLVAAYTGVTPPAVTGRGANLDDARVPRKVQVVRQALARHGPPGDPLATLASLGGLEHAALVGVVLAGAAARVPVVLDGVIAGAAALAAVAICPDSAGYLVAGHASAEAGAQVILDRLGRRALLDLGMRLGEGTGALLAVPLIQAAARVLAETATIEDALG